MCCIADDSGTSDGVLCVCLGLAQLVGEPVQPLVEPVTLDCTRGLDIPLKQREHT